MKRRHAKADPSIHLVMTHDIHQTQHDAQPFLTPCRTWDGAVRAFAPWKPSITPPDTISPDTIVLITSSVVTDIDLVLTFMPSGGSASLGTSRVSAFQEVSSSVRIDFARQATLFWLASVLQANSMSPNQLGYPFTQNSDAFRLNVIPDLTLIHDANGWQVPQYDSTEYSVNVGFGLQIGGWVYWGFSVQCEPGQSPVSINAGSYQLVRSSGAEQLGDPVALDEDHWNMPIGFSYQLVFDASGNGTLTTLS